MIQCYDGFKPFHFMRTCIVCVEVSKIVLRKIFFFIIIRRFFLFNNSTRKKTYHACFGTRCAALAVIHRVLHYHL